MNDKDRVQAVADAIGALTYAEMMGVAETLTEIAKGMDFTADEAADWADILHTWAVTVEVE